MGLGAALSPAFALAAFARQARVVHPSGSCYRGTVRSVAKDETAKIYPFKLHSGKQIYDSKNKYFITAKVFGDGGYWRDFDWAKAAKLGMEASGLKYSGEYGFAPTEMYWRINHMVSPKEEALGCLDCHGDNGRMKWQDLGYKGDPMVNAEWARGK